MKWLLLVIAGLLEMCWAAGLKYSRGFIKLMPSVFTIVGMIASFYFLSLALRSLPLGTAYAIWTGIGTVGTVILGIILFKEPVDNFKETMPQCPVLLFFFAFWNKIFQKGLRRKRVPTK